MFYIAGIVIIIILLARKRQAVKKPGEIFGWLVAIIVILNTGIISSSDFSILRQILKGMIYGGIFLAVFGKKFAHQEVEKKEVTLPHPPKSLPAMFTKKNQILTEKPQLKESNTESDKEIAVLVVKDHLTRRGFKVVESHEPEIELLAIDYEKQEFFVKIIAFTYENKENRIILTETLYEKAVSAGRKFLLFVITQTLDDEDASYLGNYVKAYKMDSIIEDAGFKKEGSSYAVSLGKFSKNASDWETRIRR